MPMNMDELVRSIERRLPEIHELSDQQRDHARRGKNLVRELISCDLNEFNERLATTKPKGAIPMPEGKESSRDWRLIRRFRGEFGSMVGAREWAREVLNGRSVGAVDGSQIYPGNELILPFGLVNIGWYINHHDGNYDMDHHSRLLLPDELGFNPESGVNLLREEGEILKLRELYGSSEREDLLLLDGSMVLSFALHVFDTTRNRYIRGILSLLDTIRKENGPLFAAYVDNSRATDLCRMLSSLLDSTIPDEEEEAEGNNEETLEEEHKVEKGDDGIQRGVSKRRANSTDASLFTGSMDWGDRTAAFLCARDDILKYYVDGNNDYTRDIAFFYLKTSVGRVGRVEFPQRIAEEGRVEELADVIRAQLIIGGGYPHALDRAHHEANVSLSEREKFLTTFRLIAEKHDLVIGNSLKAQKKRE